jgi:hypothetical protein
MAKIERAIRAQEIKVTPTFDVLYPGALSFTENNFKRRIIIG